MFGVVHTTIKHTGIIDFPNNKLRF